MDLFVTARKENELGEFPLLDNLFVAAIESNNVSDTLRVVVTQDEKCLLELARARGFHIEVKWPAAGNSRVNSKDAALNATKLLEKLQPADRLPTAPAPRVKPE